MKELSELEKEINEYVKNNKTNAAMTEGRKASYPYTYAHFFIDQSKIFEKKYENSKHSELRLFYRSIAAENNLKEIDMINLLAKAYLEIHNIHLNRIN